MSDTDPDGFKQIYFATQKAADEAFRAYLTSLKANTHYISPVVACAALIERGVMCLTTLDEEARPTPHQIGRLARVMVSRDVQEIVRYTMVLAGVTRDD